MNIRLTLASAAAVILAAVSLYPLIQGSTWFWAGAGAVIVAAAAGIISRLPVKRAAVTGSVLALIAVIPMFLTPSWLLWVIGVVIVAIPAAGQLRQRLLQALGCLITYLAMLLIYLNLVFAAGLSIAAVIPTRASVTHLWSIAGDGLNARSLAPPVPGTPGLVLLAVAGIGLIAVATDLLAVRLRSPAMAGLPLLALYCVRITTSARQGGIGAAVVFCLGLVGYLALLAVDGRERLRVWGRVVTVWGSSPSDIPTQAEGVDTRALAASGRRIGLAAACIALVIPLVVPGISVHDLLRSGSVGAGPGQSSGSPITLPTPLVQMRAQLLASATQTVLTYRTTAADPPEQYLQIYVLNYNVSSGAWTLGPLGRFSPAGSRAIRVPGLSSATPTTHPKTQVTFSHSVSSGYTSRLTFLPVPYAPAAMQISAGTWVEDNQALMVYSGGSSLSGLSYTVTSTEPSPRSSQLNAGPPYPGNIASNYLSAPSGQNGELATLAQQITAGAQTPYQKALKLQSYFTSGGFTYSVTANLPNSTAGLVKFLYTTKAGMCQQFALAMATLARLVGIPSRIAVGYTAGSRNRNGTWRVTTADAHAWPELYFTGVGWLRFEPTPGGATGQGTATVPQYAPGPVNSSPAGSTSLTPTGLSPGLLGGVNNIPGERRVTGSTAAHNHPAQSHSSLIGWILLAVAASLIVLLVIPMFLRMLVRRRRSRTTGDAAAAHAAWRELRDSLADYGFGSPVSESPRAAARRITAAVRLDPEASQAVGRIVSAEERARYAPAPLSSGTLRADTAAFRRALSQEAGWRARLRAVLLPRSVVGPARRAVQQALDVFGWMDALGLRFRFAVRQHQE
jgi:transglutaminase-like putative cysteine protease